MSRSSASFHTGRPRVVSTVHRAFGAVRQCALVLACAIAFGGCNPGSGSRPVSLNIWQTQMQTYVRDQGNGDMNALRDVEIMPGQPGFRVFSNDRPEQSKDIAGVLVGVLPRGSETWYVYVVGNLDREQVTSIHLAAVRSNSDQFQWVIGEDSQAGTTAYRAQREKAWRAHQGDREPPRSAFGFPNPEDQFSMLTTGDTITVRDATSGAAWTLTIAATTPVQSK
jgi:hypothetical protein